MVCNDSPEFPSNEKVQGIFLTLKIRTLLIMWKKGTWQSTNCSNPLFCINAILINPGLQTEVKLEGLHRAGYQLQAFPRNYQYFQLCFSPLDMMKSVCWFATPSLRSGRCATHPPPFICTEQHSSMQIQRPGKGRVITRHQANFKSWENTAQSNQTVFIS